MNRKEEIKHVMNILSNLIIFAFITLSFGYVYCTKYSNANSKGNLAVVCIYMVILLLTTSCFNGNKFNHTKMLESVASYILAIWFSNAMGYVIIYVANEKVKNVKTVLFLTLVQMAVVLILFLLVSLINKRFFHRKKIILVQGKTPQKDFLLKIKNNTDGYDVCKKIDYKEGIEKVCRDVLDFDGVFLYDIPAEDRNAILKYCYKHNITCFVVPKISDIIMKGTDELYLVDTPIVLAENRGLYLTQRAIKRLFDIIISGVSIIITLPAMAIIAMVVKICDGGPVLYKQIRLTEKGREFMMYKFRSMRLDAEDKGAQLAKENDSRVTSVGGFLRNLHLDELPQLFNVFMGHMSMVGPRPERPEIFDKYRKDIPEFDFRLKVKAGLTGYAQVYGKYNTKPIDKLKLDLTYIQKYSFWLDLKLLILTIKAIFRRENWG